MEDYGYPKNLIQTRPQYRTSKRPSDEIGSYPVDIAIFVAAVSDWKVENYFEGKMKKINEKMNISLLQNEDIFHTAHMKV